MTAAIAFPARALIRMTIPALGLMFAGSGCGANHFSFDADAAMDAGSDTSTRVYALRDGGRMDGGTAAEAGLTLADGGPAGVEVTRDLDFGGVGCGHVGTPAAVTVRNTGSSPFTFSVSLGRAGASPFAVRVPTKTVSPHQDATIIVTPLPIPAVSAVPGNFNDTLTVTTDVPLDAPHIVPLSETAQGAILAFGTPSIPFGDVPVSTSQSSTFQVVNTGTLSASIHLALGSGSSPSFAVVPTDTAVVSNGTALTANATFSPTSAGAATGSVVIDPDPTTVLCAPLPPPLMLVGTGENGGLTVSTSALSFGPTSCGQTATSQMLTLTNSGNSPLSWSLNLSNTSPSPYTVTPTTTGSLAAGAAVTLVVTPGAIPASSSVQANFYADTITINTDVIGDEPHVVTLSQTAKGAILAVNPAAVGFGDVPVNTTVASAFQVVNSGNAQASVTLTSSSTAFSVTGPTIVDGGQDGSFKASFSPGSSITPQSGSIALSTSSVLCAPLPTPLSVTGTGTNGVVAFSPSSLAFGNQGTASFTACGTQASAQQVVFSNGGNEAYTISASLGGGASSPYAFSILPASGVVAASGGTATITVTPNAIPQTSAVPGSYGDTLTVTTTAAGDSPHAITLVQSAYGAILSAPPSMIPFPATPVGAQSSSQIGITNTGNAPATLTWTAVSSSVFTFDPSVSLPPAGVTTNTNALFTPTSAMMYTATAVMGVSSSTVLCQPIPSPNVTLAGTGTDSPVISVTPSPVDFNMVSCGTSGGTRAVTIKNSSVSTVTWSAALTAGTNFSVAPASGSILSGATGTLTVTSNAIPVSASTMTTANAFGDTLTITTNAMGDAPHAIPVKETAQGSILSWNPTSLNLPITSLGQPVSFAVQNTGNVAATVTVALANPGPATLTLNAPVTGSTASGSPFQTSITEGLTSSPSMNATVTLSTATGTVLCQPAPAALQVTAN